jgi:hypothetical protein
LRAFFTPCSPYRKGSGTGKARNLARLCNESVLGLKRHEEICFEAAKLNVAMESSLGAVEMKDLKAGSLIQVIRLAMFSILVIGMLGSGAELILLDHMEDWRQWIPLILIALGLLACGWHAFCATARSVRILRALCVAFIASGLAGIYFHYQGSAEFKLESNPSLHGWPLFWAAVKGKAPPLLAPGAMMQLGLIGWTYTFKHPALSAAREKGE